MKRSISLLFLAAIASSLTASQPLRHLRIKLTDGTTEWLPISPKEAFSKHDCHCPAHFEPHHPSRSLYAANADGLGRLGERSMGILNSIGEQRIPMLMVEFADVAFQPTTTKEKLDSVFNHRGYLLNKQSRGSVRDYFEHQSYGRFSPRFEVLTTVKLSRERAYYGGNAGSSKNQNVYALYKEAIELAQKQGIDFSGYVQEGGVPLVVLLHAGPGEHDAFETGADNYPWAHFAERGLTAGGLNFKSYFIGCELMSSYKWETVVVDGQTKRRHLLDEKGNPIVDSTELEGIGVFCHEMGHALGLPDFYSTNGTSYQTPDFHDIMDYGQYGNDGYRPYGYSAYERNYMGWLQLHELADSAAYLHLSPLHELGETPHPKAYIIRNSTAEHEYFILENRQPSTWFATGLGKGMLVHHIHYNRTDWSMNQANTNPKALRYVVVPADGQWQNNKNGTPAAFQSDFFPGTQGVTEFSGNSTPAMTWQNAGGLLRPLYGINQTAEGEIRFAYLDATLTGISRSTPLVANEEEAWYSLDGRRTTHQPAQPGIYLHHGKKIILQ